MYILISVLILIVCVLLVLVVLVQNSKGGGLASNFASSNQFMGVRKTADFLEKATWILAVSLLVLSLISVIIIPPANQVQGGDNELKEMIDNAKTTPAKGQPAKQQPVQGYQAPPGQAPGQGAAPAPAPGQKTMPIQVTPQKAPANQAPAKQAPATPAPAPKK